MNTFKDYLNEQFSAWEVELPDFKKVIKVDKARAQAEAIKKAVKMAGGKGDDWKTTKIGKVKKLK